MQISFLRSDVALSKKHCRQTQIHNIFHSLHTLYIMHIVYYLKSIITMFWGPPPLFDMFEGGPGQLPPELPTLPSSKSGPGGTARNLPGGFIVLEFFRLIIYTEMWWYYRIWIQMSDVNTNNRLPCTNDPPLPVAKTVRKCCHGIISSKKHNRV